MPYKCLNGECAIVLIYLRAGRMVRTVRQGDAAMTTLAYFWLCGK
jgi:hypothetical protein